LVSVTTDDLPFDSITREESDRALALTPEDFGGRVGGITKPVKNIEQIFNKVEKEIVKNPYETAVAFDGTGKEILRKIGGQSNVVFTEKEMIDLLEADKITFTHNHPKDWSFSPQDIYLTGKCKINEMRAVGEKYLYRAKLKEDINYYQMQEIVQKKNIEIKGRFTEEINKNRMVIEEANNIHWHTVWNEIQKENDWLFYERTIR